MTNSLTPQHLHEIEHTGLKAGAGHWDLRDYAAELASEHSKVFYMTEPAEGFVLYRIVADEVEIMNLAVRLKGMGHGRALLESFLALPLLGSPVRKIFLEVAASNHAARKLYAGLGFSETGLRRAYYRSGEDAVSCVLELAR
jgi:[ribosomal protein S18]-alanine N-acetyltransferase